jgi:CheY-like chemotaxis protein
MRGSNCSSILESENKIHMVNVDSSQITQVLNNLIINSQQAMNEGGEITIRISQTQVQNEVNDPLNVGKFVKITIEDTGVGIPPQVQHQIFQPYFTTKSKGTGLGLATSYSIIKKHGGFFKFKSEENIGTTFTIYLPLCEEEEETENLEKKVLSNYNGDVLIMDDDPIVRSTLSKMLKQMNFTAETTTDGNEALLRYREKLQNGTPFSFTIMDLTIPGGFGSKELVNNFLELDAGAKIIVSSGYSNDPVLSKYKKFGFRGALLKPYTFEELKKVISKINYSSE